MKNSITLVLIVMLFVVLGCSMLRPKEDKVDTPTPTTDATPTTDSTSKPPTSGGDGLSIDKFNQIKNGMSYQEVVNILGSEGTETRSSESGNIKIVSYKWEGDKFQRVFATFRDGKLTSKAQTGLSNTSTTKDGDADITMEKYNQIKTGMSYDEVVKIIGSEGEESNSTTVGKYELKTYIWKGAEYSRIFATFRNNELSSKSQSRLR
ncbi:MAG: DUF3862 domain-containing protein [Pyrinomonadaceae bacterium]